jgi:hypothetical protein
MQGHYELRHESYTSYSKSSDVDFLGYLPTLNLRTLIIILSYQLFMLP